jgi:hypothetical protein
MRREQLSPESAALAKMNAVQPEMVVIRERTARSFGWEMVVSQTLAGNLAQYPAFDPERIAGLTIPTNSP